MANPPAYKSFFTDKYFDNAWPPKANKWSLKFNCPKNVNNILAIAKERPVIAVWSNGEGCGHCATVTRYGFQNAEFKDWVKKSNCYFIYGDSTGHTINGTTYKHAESSVYFHWCRNNTKTAYPFMRVYYAPNGKVTIDKCYDGNTLDQNKKTGPELVKLLNKISALAAYIKKSNEAPSTSGQVVQKAQTLSDDLIDVQNTVDTNGKFIGWKDLNTGSADSFAVLSNFSKTNFLPIIAVYAKDTTMSFDSLIGDMNANSQSILQKHRELNSSSKPMRFGWFQGVVGSTKNTDTTNAYNFMVEHGATSSAELIFMFYCKFEDGYEHAEFKYYVNISTTQKYIEWISSCYAAYANTLAPAHSVLNPIALFKQDSNIVYNNGVLPELKSAKGICTLYNEQQLKAYGYKDSSLQPYGYQSSIGTSQLGQTVQIQSNTTFEILWKKIEADPTPIQTSDGILVFGSADSPIPFNFKHLNIYQKQTYMTTAIRLVLSISPTSNDAQAFGIQKFSICKVTNNGKTKIEYNYKPTDTYVAQAVMNGAMKTISSGRVIDIGLDQTTSIKWLHCSIASGMTKIALTYRFPGQIDLSEYSSVHIGFQTSSAKTLSFIKQIRLEHTIDQSMADSTFKTVYFKEF